MDGMALLAIAQNWTAGIVGGGVAVLVVAWLALRYWIATTHDRGNKDIPTPTINRLNQQALESMDPDPEVQAALAHNEPAPADLLNLVPDDQDAESESQKPKTD